MNEITTPALAACPTCEAGLQITRDSILTVDLDVYDGDQHRGWIAPLIHVSDTGRIEPNGEVTWLSMGQVTAATSDEMSVSDGTQTGIGCRRVDGHSAVVLGDEFRLTCTACGWVIADAGAREFLDRLALGAADRPELPVDAVERSAASGR